MWMSPMAALLCLGDLEGEKEASAGGAKVEEVDQLAKRQEYRMQNIVNEIQNVCLPCIFLLFKAGFSLYISSIKWIKGPPLVKCYHGINPRFWVDTNLCHYTGLNQGFMNS